MQLGESSKGEVPRPTGSSGRASAKAYLLMTKDKNSLAIGPWHLDLYHRSMSSYLDHLPSREREKIRKTLRSPEAYAALRERVKGPEDLEREMERSSLLAELSFALESEPHVRQKLKEHLEKQMSEQGIENVFGLHEASRDTRSALESGKFHLEVGPDKHHIDHLLAVPEGNRAEKIPVQISLSQQFINSMMKKS